MKYKEMPIEEGCGMIKSVKKDLNEKLLKRIGSKSTEKMLC
jgi:hypothetical protein